jgi:hypothetical protein
MTRPRRSFQSLALLAAMFHTLALSGCGGSSSPAGPGGNAEVRLKISHLAAARIAAGPARSAAVSGATVLVDGVAAGVTDATGEIVLQLDAGTHSITVSSGDVTSSSFQVTVADGESITLEVEMEQDGTLAIEQDTDRDGDVDGNDSSGGAVSDADRPSVTDDDDADDDADADADEDDDDDDNGDGSHENDGDDDDEAGDVEDDDHEGGGSHAEGTVANR